MYRSIVTVDGDEVSRTVVDGDDVSCADAEPADDDAYEFPSPQPCPLDTAGSVQFDTAALADGEHAVQVTVEDAAGNVDVVLSRTVSTHNAPISTAVPALGGQAKVGAQLTAGPGQWDGAPTGYGYRWLRCDPDGSGCAGIPGADASAYVLTSADAYHRILVEVTAANHSGAATARSSVSAVVADAAGRTSPLVGGGSGSSPGIGGVAGLTNPLGQLSGHVPNGARPAGRPRLEIAFRLAAGRSATHLRSARDRRWTIAGRLLDGNGRGIEGARIGVALRVAGRTWVARGELRSGRGGAVSYTLPAGPGRSVKLTYFPFSDSRGFVASNVVTEDVLAPVTIRADHRQVTGARVVTLSGRVRGELLPRGGVLVTLQGYQAGFGWRTFRTVRTTARGVWSTRYRFRLSHGRFGFRAVVPRQGSFPFVTSRSGSVFVTVS
ncbi:MAG TPA: hypothetical protein VE972_12755 [Conexibacter sp.]|nr:hypothetical protein [Conexibacter sp.]